MITLDTLPTNLIVDEHLWEEVFRDTPKLHGIIQVVACCHIENLILALQPRDGVVPVPALTDIRFRRVEFERGECSSGQKHMCGKRCLVCLHGALASRAEAGYALQRLIFDDCGGTLMEDGMELSKVVEKVVWR